ncbi:alpha/beta fold hydrolase [Streptomyces sp. NPDC093089]|uniref:alpha/beta fold hydrolase n=1 Tax=Streptomyces sp. NPDC093089 TaxID=3366024 RepID=UPI00381D7FC1
MLGQTAEASGDRIVRLPGGDLHVVQEGPPDAPTVGLLHGLGGSTAWWDPVLPALRDLHVVRVDLLGHGSSAKPAGGYGMAEQARQVGAALEQLGEQADSRVQAIRGSGRPGTRGATGTPRCAGSKGSATTESLAHRTAVPGWLRETPCPMVKSR